MKLRLGIGLGLLTILAGFFGYLHLQGGKVFGASNAPTNSTFNTSTDSYLNYGTQDVVGTHVGTTTAGNFFYTIDATSSYISKIGNEKSFASYQIKIVGVTSTINNLNLSVQGSNDYLCDTQAGSASTTTDVVQANINWYDAMVYLRNRVHPTSLVSNSSSLIMNFTNVLAGSGQEIVLTDINFRCLRLLVSASGTQPYVGLNVK